MNIMGDTGADSRDIIFAVCGFLNYNSNLGFFSLGIFQIIAQPTRRFDSYLISIWKYTGVIA